MISIFQEINDAVLLDCCPVGFTSSSWFLIVTMALKRVVSWPRAWRQRLHLDG